MKMVKSSTFWVPGAIAFAYHYDRILSGDFWYGGIEDLFLVSTKKGYLLNVLDLDQMNRTLSR